jgi:hypothetical protein
MILDSEEFISETQASEWFEKDSEYAQIVDPCELSKSATKHFNVDVAK